MQADEKFREVSFEIQTLCQSYVNQGGNSEEYRNAIRGIMMLSAGLSQVLQWALSSSQQPQAGG
jgi:hypothetical protein